MSKTIRKLQDLLCIDSKKACKYFEQNKDILFNKVNVSLHGAELLSAFYKLQSSLALNQDRFTGYKSAIDFYYDNCNLLKTIPITNDDNFKLYKRITVANEEFENNFHELLYNQLPRIQQPAIDTITKMLGNLLFATQLLDKSIAKIQIKPRDRYKQYEESLKLALKEANTSSTLKVATMLSAPLPIQSTNIKPQPPHHVGVPEVRPQLSFKSAAAVPLKRRILAQETEAHKKLSIAQDNATIVNRPSV